MKNRIKFVIGEDKRSLQTSGSWCTKSLGLNNILETKDDGI